jgi:hypothetical protein
VAKQGKLIKEASKADQDSDLTPGAVELKAGLTIFQNEYAAVDLAYQSDVKKLEVLTTRHTVLASETALWETN